MVHFVASDAHYPKKRPPKLFSAFKKLVSMIGKARAEKIMFESPQELWMEVPFHSALMERRALVQLNRC
jgi:tyrosine-protein phosphatase YwqE